MHRQVRFLPSPRGSAPWRRAALALALAVSLPVASWGQTVLEARLAALEPCKGLRVEQKVLGATVGLGLNRLQALEVRHAALVFAGDRAGLALAGRLACATPEGSLVAGDASVDIRAHGEVDLAACSVERLDIEATAFSGSLGELVAAVWEPLLRPLLAEAAGDALVRACADFAEG